MYPIYPPKKIIQRYSFF